jgi:hypothetical protein
MLVDLSQVWPEYKCTVQTGISGVTRLVFRYVGIAGMLYEGCRYMYRYAGLT